MLLLTGLILFFHDRFTDFKNLGNRQTIGVSIVFFSAIAWTIYALLQKKLLRKFKSFQLLFMMCCFSALVLLPFVSPGLLFQLTGFQFFLLSFCCINTLVAYGCFTEALNCWEASKVSAVLAVAPLFTIVGLQVIVSFNPEYAYSDRLTVLSIIGAMLLVLGSMLTALMPILSIHFKSRD